MTTTLTPAETNAALKAISRSIISLRNRLDQLAPGTVRDQMQSELDDLVRAREALEAGG